ncbi:MAG: tripartite tricarboxylate transporter TctB family protein [Rubrobacter sp.]|nr:tripartite tricarboxylate transporter TctB family protein [Rubrobacter sp.]
MSIRQRINSDLVSGGVVLLAVLVFWSQRDFTNPLARSLPDTILALLTVLALVLVVRGIVQPQSSSPFTGTKSLGLLVAVALLVAWVFLVSPLGFLYSGILMFFVASLYMREWPIRVKGLILDAVVSVLVVGGVYLIFTRVLLVPLSPSPF